MDQKMMFYWAVLESIIRYGMLAWYGNPSVQAKSKLLCLVQTVMKVVGRTGNISRDPKPIKPFLVRGFKDEATCLNETSCGN